MSDQPLDRLCEELQKATKGTVLRDEPMSAHTTFHIGGPAEAVFISKVEREIRAALLLAGETGIPVTVMGWGSNLLVSDKGVEGLVLKVADGREIAREGNRLEVNAGTGLAEVCEFARRDGLGGLDALVGIPGTLGGAIRMNAGAFGRRVGDKVVWAEALARDGRKKRFERDEIEFQYRGSRFSRGDWVICRVALDLQPEEPASIGTNMKEWLRKRSESHSELWICAGCIFKNPPVTPAGRLIEEAGCKGMRVGDAVISERHANFIINVGEATFQDIITLMTIARERVYEMHKVALEPEVVVIGKGLPQPLFPPLGQEGES